MAPEHTNITEAIVKAAAEAARVAVQAMAAARAENNTRHVGSKIGGLVMKQPTFNWKAED